MGNCIKKVKPVIVALFCAMLVTTDYYGSAEMPAVSSTVYTWGSTGDTVRNIQDKLKRWGYYNGNIDGIYGYQTWEAVMHFQQRNGLGIDGITGKETLEALGIYETVGQSGGTTARENEIWLLASVIHGEARGETYIGQVAVGAVVLNRVNHPQFPSTIAGVIYQPGAFEAVADGQIYLTPSDSAVEAARDAMNGWDPTNGAIFYWNPAKTTNEWMLSIPVSKTIGNHDFGIR